MIKEHGKLKVANNKVNENVNLWYVSGDECFAPHGNALKHHTQKRLTHETERLITYK
jgi:hypothetical protein